MLRDTLLELLSADSVDAEIRVRIVDLLVLSLPDAISFREVGLPGTREHVSELISSAKLVNPQASTIDDYLAILKDLVVQDRHYAQISLERETPSPKVVYWIANQVGRDLWSLRSQSDYGRSTWSGRTEGVRTQQVLSSYESHIPRILEALERVPKEGLKTLSLSSALSMAGSLEKQSRFEAEEQRHRRNLGGPVGPWYHDHGSVAIGWNRSIRYGRILLDLDGGWTVQELSSERDLQEEKALLVHDLVAVYTNKSKAEGPLRVLSIRDDINRPHFTCLVRGQDVIWVRGRKGRAPQDLRDEEFLKDLSPIRALRSLERWAEIEGAQIATMLKKLKLKYRA